MNTLVLTLALIFLPGIIWARLDARYARHVKPSQFELLVNVFVFGLVAYLATYLLYLLPPVAKYATFDLTRLPLDDTAVAQSLQVVVVDDILAATIVALILAPVWLAVQRHKLIVRLLQAVGATKRYGDEDVWDFLLSSDDPRSKYVNLRDDQTGQTFSGYVDMFSEEPGLRELVLSQVQGFETATGAPTIEVARLYLARDPKGMTLEFPADDANVRS
ncbi:DUF6338 family protein [Paracoccus marcusii]|uniref:DUF6338 family protein n=1 Tax=Paracoccus marcusii TaxID=59779 RepID=UPI002493AD3E|nr:DUF6338 family protein [Paracoccus marcusii]